MTTKRETLSRTMDTGDGASNRQQPALPGEPGFTWDSLATPIAMPSKTVNVNSNFNAIADVPVAIRSRAESSLHENTRRVSKARSGGNKTARVDYYWEVQPVPTIEHGKQFTEWLDKYAKYRPASGEVPFASGTSPKGQVTARHGDPMYYRDRGDGIPVACDISEDGAYLGVRFSVCPFIKRGKAARLPGTAS